MSVIDCFRQASQNRCPHFVDTKVRPDLAKVLLLSMQIGQVISGEVSVRGLLGGVDGSIITSLSSVSDKQIALSSFAATLAATLAIETVRSTSALLATGDVRSTTIGSSLSEVRSTTLSSAWPPESVLSVGEDENDPVELSDDVEIGRLDRSSLEKVMAVS